MDNNNLLMSHIHVYVVVEKISLIFLCARMFRGESTCDKKPRQ